MADGGPGRFDRSAAPAADGQRPTKLGHLDRSAKHHTVENRVSNSGDGSHRSINEGIDAFDRGSLMQLSVADYGDATRGYPRLLDIGYDLATLLLPGLRRTPRVVPPLQ